MHDAHGGRTLFQAWTKVLNGGPAEIETIPSMPWDLDPFSELKQYLDKARDPTEPRRGWYDPPLLGKVRFVIGLLWRQFIDPAEERIICVPQKFLAERKAEIMAELAKERSNEWVGSSDVLMAWWYKVGYRLHVSSESSVHSTIRRLSTPTGKTTRPYLCTCP